MKKRERDRIKCSCGHNRWKTVQKNMIYQCRKCDRTVVK